MNEVSQLLTALSNFVWPSIFLLCLFFFGSALKSLIQSREFDIEIGGFKVSVRASIEKLNAEIAEIKSRLTEPAGAKLDSVGGSEFATSPTHDDLQPSEPSARGRRILWVDDKPESNAFEIAQLQSVGLQIDTAKTTSEGIKILDRGPAYDLVISDIGRTENGRYERKAGLDFLSLLRKENDQVPVIFFTTRRTAELTPVKNAISSDPNVYATGSTVELFKLVSEALGPLVL